MVQWLVLVLHRPNYLIKVKLFPCGVISKERMRKLKIAVMIIMINPI